MSQRFIKNILLHLKSHPWKKSQISRLMISVNWYSILIDHLANDPVVLEDELMFGDLISFNDYHVAGIIKDEYL